MSIRGQSSGRSRRKLGGQAFLSRVVALSLLILVLGGGYVLGIEPLYLRYNEIDQKILEAEDLRARYQRIAAGREASEAQLAELDARQQDAGIYLEGGTDTLAAATLQEKLTGLFQSNNARLRSIQILPVAVEEDYKRIGVRVQLTTTIESLYEIFNELETGNTLLFMDKLDIRQRSRRSRRKDNNAQVSPELIVRFDLSGYIRPEAP